MQRPSVAVRVVGAILALCIIVAALAFFLVAWIIVLPVVAYFLIAGKRRMRDMMRWRASPRATDDTVSSQEPFSPAITIEAEYQDITPPSPPLQSPSDR